MPKHLRLFRPEEAREADFPVQFPPPVSHINCLHGEIFPVFPRRDTHTALSGAFVLQTDSFAFCFYLYATGVPPNTADMFI